MDRIATDGTQRSKEMKLFIFRTNIETRSSFARLRHDLEKMPGLQICTIDLEDCDRVLRVGCENIRIEAVVEEVTKHGFICQELAD